MTVPEGEERSTGILQKQKKGGAKSTGRNMNSADKWMQTEGLLRRKRNKPRRKEKEKENENFEMQTDND